MKWKGETENQWRARVAKWHMRFAYLPTQMEDGTWVFWDYYYARVHFGFLRNVERVDLEKFELNYEKVNGEWQSSASLQASATSSNPPPPKRC